jgi:hypothetical protein
VLSLGLFALGKQALSAFHAEAPQKLFEHDEHRSPDNRLWNAIEHLHQRTMYAI